MSCPSANHLFAYQEGQLDDAQGVELGKHLDACHDCRELLEVLGRARPKCLAPPVGNLRRPSQPPSARLPTLLEPGELLDQYLIIRLLARSGMSDVYVAFDTWLDRYVAIKAMRRWCFASKSDVDRFDVEARATARFSHPNIVTLYGIGRIRGIPYLVLEYVRGETLRQRLQQGPLAWSDTRHVAVSVACAVAEAHRQQVVHGDLKPTNVMLGLDGRVRAFDFGLARLVYEGEAADALADGQEGSFTEGTPRYMAPEQWETRQTTCASDVWALGVMMFEMQTGRWPFEPAEVAKGAVDVPRVLGPSAQLPPLFPPALRQLLTDCWRVHPAQRPSMNEVHTRLAAIP